jgi:hypothetical protein
MPQFNSGAAEQIGRFSEGLLLRLLQSHDSTQFRIAEDDENAKWHGQAVGQDFRGPEII